MLVVTGKRLGTREVSDTRGRAALLLVLVLAWCVTLAQARSASALPVLTLSDGLLDNSGPTPLYTFSLSSSEILAADLFVPLLNSNPTEYLAPASVVMGAGLDEVEFGVTALLSEVLLISGPSITLGSVTGAEIGSGTGSGSLPGFVPEISILDGQHQIPLTWTFEIFSDEPVSADVFVPVTVNNATAFAVLGGGATIVNGSRTGQIVVSQLVPNVVGPWLTVVPTSGFTIGDGFAVPEPSTAWLAAVAALAGATGRRRPHGASSPSGR